MDRNTITGFVLIGLLLMAFLFYNDRQAAKVQQEEAKHRREAFIDSISSLSPVRTDTSARDTSGTAIAADSAHPKTTETFQPGLFLQPGTSANKTFTLENDDVKLTVSSKGGEVTGVQLKKYKTFDAKPLLLLQDSNNHKTFNLVTGGINVSTANLFFESSGPVTAGDSTTLSLRVSAGDGKYFEQRYSLPKKGYLVNYQVNLVNLDEVIPRNSGYLSMDWTHRVPKLEKSKNYENRYSALYYKYKSDDVEHTSESKDADVSAPTALQWVSFKQQFFNSTLISLDKDGFKNATLHSKMDADSEFLKNYSASVILPYDHRKMETYSMQYYFGPNNYQALKHLDIGLEKVLSLGWFAFVSEWLIIPTFNFLERYISNYGIIILLLTLFVKIIVTPLTYKSQQSMAKTKVLKPEIDELKEKYKDDQQKFGAEQMKLYSKAGVNPLSGCIPTLLIMPVLIAMYSFFPASIELRQQGFLWAHDLSTYDSIYHLPFTIPWYGDHVSLFTLLMTITSILYAVANSQLSGAAEGPMKYMPYVFPVMLLGMFNSFPAALTYFYLLNNLISYGQQWMIGKFLIDEKALHRQIQENKKKPAKTGGFADKLRKQLEQAQKQQEQAKKTVKKK